MAPLKRTSKKVQGSRIFLGPEQESIFIDAISASGCELVTNISDADGVVWFGRDPIALESLLTENVLWLQIPDAGAEKWLETSVAKSDILLTCASGIYGFQVAEHALALILGCARQLEVYSRQTRWNPTAAPMFSLGGSNVLIIGAGGIGTSLVGMLKPLQCSITVLSKSGRSVPLADKSLPITEFESALKIADIIVLAAPATPETYKMLNARTFKLMKNNSIVVNVARGNLIDSDALLEALDQGMIHSAGLDVTEPEPLPDDHRFFTHPRILLTPHVANPAALKKASLAGLVGANCKRFLKGEELVGIIDVKRGY